MVNMADIMSNMLIHLLQNYCLVCRSRQF